MLEKKYDYTSLLLFLLAIFSTMPIVSIPIGGKCISIFSFLLPITLLKIFFDGIYIEHFSKTEKLFFSFLLFSLLGSFFGFFYFWGESNFSIIAISSIPKILIYFSLGYILFCARLKENQIKVMATGLLTGAILNLIWASLDGVLFYISGLSINNKTFSYYLKYQSEGLIRYGMLSLTYGDKGIRACGFNYDPSHIGMLAPFVFAYSLISEKKWLIFLVVFSALASQSVTVIASSLIILLFFNLLAKKNIKQTIIIVTVILISLFFITQTPLGNALYRVKERSIEKIDDKTEKYRKIYNFQFPLALLNSPIHVLWGTGFGTASNAFYRAGLIDFYEMYDPENTYVSYLFDLGFIGLIFYIKLLYEIIKITWINSKKFPNKANSIVLASCFAICSSNIFYHYILYATTMMMLITSCMWCRHFNKKILFLQNNGK